MFPSFGYQYSPGDLLSSKTFEKVAFNDVETVSNEVDETGIRYQSIDPSKVLTGLCHILGCNSGQQMINAVLNDEERFEPLLNFLYSQPHPFPCFGFSVIRKENESCFEVSNSENSQADLMVSKTYSGTFFLCVLTSKLLIKDQDLVMKKFAFLLETNNALFGTITKEHCEYFDNEDIKVTVFANWNEMVCNQMSVRDSLEKMMKYDEDCKLQLISFEVDDFFTCLRERPLPLDPDFETCYRLMRSIKNKVTEFQLIFDSKKKKSTSGFKYLLSDLQKELKQTYFLKFEHIEQMNEIFVDALNVLEKGLKSFLSTGTVAEPSLYQILESCLTSILTKYNIGNCNIRDNTVFFSFKDMKKLMEYFGKKAFIALKSGTDNFKQWITPDFLQKYPLCYVQQYPDDILDPLVLIDGDHVYGFGTVTLKKMYSKPTRHFDFDAFCCVNPEHKCERFWKCTTCNAYVASNGKETFCKCGVYLFEYVDFRCSFSGGKICVKPPRRRTNAVVDNKDSNDINIVLVGPVGSGKSTLINAVMNYLEFPKYKDASSRKLFSSIPYKFSMYDDNYKELVVCSKAIPLNCPENFSSTSGITKRPRTYELSCNGKNYRFLDTIGYGPAMKDLDLSNLRLWKSLKHIDAFWITISAAQILDDDDSWIRSIVKSIPKLLYSRVYFVFTNIQSKHSLHFNKNAAFVKRFFSQLKEFSFDEKNVFTIENDCLKILYAKNDGCSLTGVQDSIDKAWTESRHVVIDLLRKAFASKTTASKSHDEEIFFLNNLFYLYFRLKRVCSEDELIQCFDLLKHSFAYLSPSTTQDKPPSYGDVMKSLQKITYGIAVDSQQYKLTIEFIKTFEDFVKSRTPGLLGSVGNYLLSFVK
uniref:G domain-containing protein n=1 Tax=Panagrolaimus sp. PS1159 TaxID=55785 RepID=A0AC35GL68_9BILA